VQILLWVFLLPFVLALWIWQTGLPVWARVLLVASVFGLSIAIAASGGGENGSDAGGPPAQVQEPTPPEETAAPPPPPEPPPPPPEPPPPPPPPRAPRPIVLNGSGARVLSVTLREDSPLVVAARHSGSANFIVELVARGGGSELLFNEIGPFAGETAWADASAGGYRVRVDADGTWTVALTQPVPTGRARPVPGTFNARGSRVIPIRADDDLQPVVSAVHRGEANFIVALIGFGNLSGETLLFNEIGNFRGETLVDEMLAGDYLPHVTADGPWTMRFAP
jgi:hypothetical protein